MRPGHRFLVAASVFASAILFALAQIAAAHAILLESSPALNSSVVGPNIPITLRFNVRIDASRSRLTLVSPDATAQTLALDKDTKPDTVTSRAHNLKPGDYRIRWQVLASDGHITRGEIPFKVTQP